MIKFSIFTKRGVFVDGFCENPFAAIIMIAKFKLEGYVVIWDENPEDLN